MNKLQLTLATALLLFAAFARGATYVVPGDRQMVQAADSIVVGDVLTSYSQLNTAGEIETVTEIAVTSVLKGSVLARHILVHEPGGYLGGRAKFIADVPHFAGGDHVLLFLAKTPSGSWATWNLGLGKLNFSRDDEGRETLTRSSAVVGWNGDGTSHTDEPRVAQRFLAFVRDVAAGRTPAAEYFAATPFAERPRQPQAAVRPPSLKPAPLTTYTVTSYTADMGNGEGARWNTFPQNFYTESSATIDDIDAVATAIGAWRDNATSTISCFYPGVDDCNPSCHTSGLSAPDQRNTVLFERDLTPYGIPSYDCYLNNGGVIAIGGITDAEGTHTMANGEVFMTTFEADVEVNQGVNSCAANLASQGGPLSSNYFRAAIAHEIGHTLGFRHADQLRIDDPLNNCDTNVLLECAATTNNPAAALMQTFLMTDVGGGGSPGAALQPWDQHAAAAVYPLSAIPPTPTNVVATGTTGTNIRISWTASTGAASYQVLRRARGQSSYTALSNCCSSQTYCSGSNCGFDDSSVATNSAYVYEVAALNSGNAASQPSSPDLATTVMFTIDNPLCVGNGNPSDPPGCSGAQATTVKASVINDLVTAVNAMCFLDTNTACVGSVASSQPIAASTIRNLRTAVASVRSHLSLPSVTFTDDGPWGSGDTGHTPTFIRAVHVRELRTSVQ